MSTGCADRMYKGWRADANAPPRPLSNHTFTAPHRGHARDRSNYTSTEIGHSPCIVCTIPTTWKWNMVKPRFHCCQSCQPTHDPADLMVIQERADLCVSRFIAIREESHTIDRLLMDRGCCHVAIKPREVQIKMTVAIGPRCEPSRRHSSIGGRYMNRVPVAEISGVKFDQP